MIANLCVQSCLKVVLIDIKREGGFLQISQGLEKVLAAIDYSSD
jgi:hypothetical protein